MGASGWDYRTPYAGSVEASFRAVQEQVLASGDYLWPWEEFDEGYLEDGEGFARPSSVEDLLEAREDEEFWEGGGTHTILDLVSGDVLALTDDELITVLGGVQPTADEFDRVHQTGPSGPLADLLGEKWSGRSLVVFADGAPSEVCFWGWSGD